MYKREKNLEKEMFAVAAIVIEDFNAELSWSEFDGLLGVNKEGEQIAQEVKDVIEIFAESYPDQVSIPITPEGPFFEPVDTDPVAISWVFNLTYPGKYTFIGDLPTLKDLELDDSSNFDEYGNEIVR